MKKQVVLAAAVLGLAAAQVVPTAASRAEARAKEEGVEFRTTTFAERWRDASASVEAANASGADLSLDIAATDATTGATRVIPGS